MGLGLSPRRRAGQRSLPARRLARARTTTTTLPQKHRAWAERIKGIPCLFTSVSAAQAEILLALSMPNPRKHSSG